MSAAGRRAAGFTLIELLVAMALVGLMAAVAAGGLRFGARAWERAETLAEAESEARALRRFLRATLAGVEPVRARDGSREPPVLFAGAGDALTAVGRLPSRLAPPGLQRIGLVFQRRGDRLALVLRWSPLGLRPPAEEWPADAAEETLAEGLARGGFRYVGAGATAAGWSQRQSLPELVEVDMAWADPRGAAWPTLAAPLRLAGAR